MFLLIAIFVLLFGLCIGSFLNVVILRGQLEEAITGRSHCPHCKHVLKIWDLFPLFSYFALGGKCRYCQKPISIQYPLVELGTGFIFVIAWFAWFSNLGTNLLSNNSYLVLLLAVLEIAFIFFVSSVLLVVSVSDFRWGIIPDKIIYPSIAVAIFYQLLHSLLLFAVGYDGMSVLTSLLYTFLATFVIAAFFLSLIIITRGKGMGGGDLKLSIFIGLIMSWEALLIGAFIAFLTGGIVGVMLILLGKKRFKERIAFGPFLALGAFIGLLYGEAILQAYLKLLGP